MTALNPNTATSLLFRAGAADCVVLLALRAVNAGDTIDIGPSGANQLQNIYRAVAISVTNSGVQLACTWTGTVVSMPSGMSNDIGYLLLWGASS